VAILTIMSKNSSPIPVIVLKNISKKYSLHKKKSGGLKNFLYPKKNTFYALNNINLTINQGETVGIMGNNGSGKTTLLKIITHVTKPTQGTVITSGKLVSLIEINAGFHLDLSGRQNIYLNGLILGLRLSDIKKKIYQIIEFSGIKKSIDEPFFTYSEGMKLRLGFAIAINTDPDILVLDEGMAVGDKNFQKKLRAKFKTLIKQEKTIINVSHSADFIMQNCNRIIILKQGKIIKIGSKKLVSDYAQDRIKI